MVKSGLDPSKNSEASVPRVSQYRLATHLTIAFLLYSLFLYNGISHFVRPQAEVGYFYFLYTPSVLDLAAIIPSFCATICSCFD